MFSPKKSLRYLARSKQGLLAIFIIYLISITYAYNDGNLIFSDGQAAVWWTEGAYKVMKQDPPPKARCTEVRLFCARNEYEPFILVLRPKTRLENVRVEADPLADPQGRPIDPANISICHVGYVNVVVPTDEAVAAVLERLL